MKLRKWMRSLVKSVQPVQRRGYEQIQQSVLVFKTRFTPSHTASAYTRLSPIGLGDGICHVTTIPSLGLVLRQQSISFIIMWLLFSNSLKTVRQFWTVFLTLLIVTLTGWSIAAWILVKLTAAKTEVGAYSTFMYRNEQNANFGSVEHSRLVLVARPLFKGLHGLEGMFTRFRVGLRLGGLVILSENQSRHSQHCNDRL